MFRISGKKGFQITFANGWTASVQFGPGNYCDNYNMRIGEDEAACGENGSNTAEIAAWNKADKWYEFDDGEYTNIVKGYANGDEVLDFLNKVASLENK